MLFSILAGLLAIASSVVETNAAPSGQTNAALSGKTYAGMSGYPSSSEWQELTAAVGGRLSSAGGGSAYAYQLMANSAQDISAAVKFATAHNLRVSIINTGHDFLGRNTGAGSLRINTSRMKGMKFSKTWVPTAGNSSSISTRQAAQPQAAVVISAGMLWSEVIPTLENTYKYAATHGADSSVGASGGWAMGGGHGPLSNQFGMGSDNVLEFEVVLPNGDIVIANDDSYPDLFMALRGGGGGTFGVVTSTTMRSFPKPTMSGLEISISGRGYQDAVAYLFSVMPNMTDFGLSGYPTMTASTYSGRHRAPNKTPAEISAFWAPIAAHMQSLGATVSTKPYVDTGSTTKRDVDAGDCSHIESTFMRIECEDTKDREEALKKAGISHLDKRQAAVGLFMSSRLIAREQLNADNIPAIHRMLSAVTGGLASILPYPNAGGQVAKNRDMDVGLNPSWRDATIHMVVLGGSSPIPDMDPLSADHGAYLNEASPKEQDWKTTFFGPPAHYQKLLAVKQKYDPTNTLWCTPCVGADLLNLVNGRLVAP